MTNFQNLAFSEADMEKHAESGLFGAENFKDFHIIDEDDIIHSYNEYAYLGDKSPYFLMMERAGFLKRHGLSPIFVANEDHTKFVVTSREHMGGRLN